MDPKLAGASTQILKGVERNKAVIIFPGYARFMWWMYRLVPAAVAPMGLRMIRDMRKLRVNFLGVSLCLQPLN